MYCYVIMDKAVTPLQWPEHRGQPHVEYTTQAVGSTKLRGPLLLQREEETAPPSRDSPTARPAGKAPERTSRLRLVSDAPLTAQMYAEARRGAQTTPAAAGKYNT